MIQDAHYLEGFARALALAASKGQRAEHIVQFAGAAQTAILVERALHQEYFAHFGVSPAAFAVLSQTGCCPPEVRYDTLPIDPEVWRCGGGFQGQPFRERD